MFTNDNNKHTVCLNRKYGLPIVLFKNDIDEEIIYLLEHEDNDGEKLNSKNINKECLGKILCLESCKAYIIPNKKIDREIMCVFGPSRAGKSVFISNYLEMYKIVKNKKIYLFSEKTEDVYKDITRIALDESFIEDKLNIEHLENTLCVFDDIDSIIEKDLRKTVFDLIDRILKLGGDKHIDIIISYHMLTNYKETRYILFECHNIVIFPSTGSINQFKNLFNNYIGIDKILQQKIMSLKSRFVLINKTYPKYIIWNNGVKLI